MPLLLCLRHLAWTALLLEKPHFFTVFYHCAPPIFSISERKKNLLNVRSHLPPCSHSQLLALSISIPLPFSTHYTASPPSSNPILQHLSCSRTCSNNADRENITDQKPALSVACAAKGFARLSARLWLQPSSRMLSAPTARAPTRPSAAQLWKHQGKRDTQKVGNVLSSPREGSAIPSVSAFGLTSTRAEHCLWNQRARLGRWAATCKAREHRAVDVLRSVLLPINCNNQLVNNNWLGSGKRLSYGTGLAAARCLPGVTGQCLAGQSLCPTGLCAQRCGQRAASTHPRGVDGGAAGASVDAHLQYTSHPGQVSLQGGSRSPAETLASLRHAASSPWAPQPGPFPACAHRQPAATQRAQAQLNLHTERFPRAN